MSLPRRHKWREKDGGTSDESEKEKNDDLYATALDIYTLTHSHIHSRLTVHVGCECVCVSGYRECAAAGVALLERRSRVMIVDDELHASDGERETDSRASLQQDS